MSADESTPATPQTVGQIVDALGVKLRLKDGDMVTDVVLITKIVEADGSVRMNRAWSEGMSWIERVGLVAIAHDVELDGLRAGRSDA